MNERSLPSVGITGASGFLGSALLQHFTASGSDMGEVFALTRTLHADQLLDSRTVNWVQGDLVSPYDCASFIEPVDVVLHLAGVNTPLTSDAHLASDALSNIVPTLTLLQAIREVGRQPHVIFASSGGALYRPSSDRQSFRETDPAEPMSSYGIQKLAIEHYLRVAVEQGWLTATVLRIGNPYGVLLPPERRQGFIGVALNQLLHGRAIKLFGNEQNVRDYVHLDDMCRMFKLVALRATGFNIYNLGSGVGHSVAQLIELLEQIIAQTIEVVREPPSEDAERLPRWVVLDISKAEAEFGWSPNVSLDEGLRQLCGEHLGVL